MGVSQDCLSSCHVLCTVHTPAQPMAHHLLPSNLYTTNTLVKGNTVALSFYSENVPAPLCVSNGPVTTLLSSPNKWSEKSEEVKGHPQQSNSRVCASVWYCKTKSIIYCRGGKTSFSFDGKEWVVTWDNTQLSVLPQSDGWWLFEPFINVFPLEILCNVNGSTWIIPLRSLQR